MDSVAARNNEKTEGSSASSKEITSVVVEMETMDRIPNHRRSSGAIQTSPVSEYGGVCLTWVDLWVRVSSGKNSNRPILQGITGYARPGELLAIMGPSGSGKSTLLDALAGRLSSKTRQTGEIVINGQKQTLAYGTSQLYRTSSPEMDAYLVSLLTGSSATRQRWRHRLGSLDELLPEKMMPPAISSQVVALVPERMERL